MKYDVLIITNLPNYYKRNLFNEIGKKCSLYVVFIGAAQKQRNTDFLTIGDNLNFEYEILNKSLDRRNYLFSCLRLFNIVRNKSFGKLILGEWVNIEYWFALLFFQKRNISMMLESSIHSVQRIGIKEVLKKLFLNSIDTVFANGAKHAELAKLLKFKGKILTTNGLGIINYPTLKHYRERTNMFLYVGRLSPEKNLERLVKVFNELPYQLTIIGEGTQLGTLKALANNNIQFLGYIDNENLAEYYQSCRALILISTEEPFGLVAEEALYFGAPVIVSSVCGIVDTLCVDKENSLVVSPSSNSDIRKAIIDMTNDNIYSNIISNCDSKFIVEKNYRQVRLYVDHILL